MSSISCGGSDTNDGGGGKNPSGNVSCGEINQAYLVFETFQAWVCNFDPNNPQVMTQIAFAPSNISATAGKIDMSLTQAVSYYGGDYVISGDNSITFSYQYKTITDISNGQSTDETGGSFEMVGVCTEEDSLTFSIEGKSYDCIPSDDFAEQFI